MDVPAGPLMNGNVPVLPEILYCLRIPARNARINEEICVKNMHENMSIKCSHRHANKTDTHMHTHTTEGGVYMCFYNS